MSLTGLDTLPNESYQSTPIHVTGLDASLWLHATPPLPPPHRFQCAFTGAAIVDIKTTVTNGAAADDGATAESVVSEAITNMDDSAAFALRTLPEITAALCQREDRVVAGLQQMGKSIHPLPAR